MPTIYIPIVREDHLPDAAREGAGAVVTFDGVVRAKSNGRQVTGIYYECYREMSERELADITLEARRVHPVSYVRIVHRIGEVPAGELSLFVAVASEHRKHAFDACISIVDAIKKRVPIWKKERYADNTAEWL